MSLLFRPFGFIALYDMWQAHVCTGQHYDNIIYTACDYFVYPFYLYMWQAHVCTVQHYDNIIYTACDYFVYPFYLYDLYNLRINDVSSGTSTQVYVYNLDSTTDESTMYHPVPIHKYTCTI